MNRIFWVLIQKAFAQVLIKLSFLALVLSIGAIVAKVAISIRCWVQGVAVPLGAVDTCFSIFCWGTIFSLLALLLSKALDDEIIETE